MALIPAASLTLATSITAAATYHPGAYQWHQVYFPDGPYQGSDLNDADYYTWTEGTVSVSNMYAGISCGTNHPGTVMNWVNAWLYNYDGSFHFTSIGRAATVEPPAIGGS